MKVVPGTLFEITTQFRFFSNLRLKEVFRGDILMYIGSKLIDSSHQTQKHVFLNKNGERVHRHTYGSVEGFLETFEDRIERIEL
jgi:hypothetical protein